MAKDTVRPDEPVVIRITDFSGGHNDTVAPALLNPNEAQRAHRVNYDQKGTIQPQKGRKRRYGQRFSDHPVSGLGAFYTKAGTGHLLIASGTSVFTDEPHMGHIWDAAADWKREEAKFEGAATADRTNGSLMNSDVPPYRNEKQKVEIKGKPTGGKFKLTFMGETTGDIAFDATADDVRVALVKLGAINGENEQQKITISGSPTGGTFTLTFKKEVTGEDGEPTTEEETTDPIAYNATAEQVQTALAALEGIGAGNVTVTGSAKGPYTITFINALGNKDLPELTATSSLTGGTNPSITVETVTNGSKSDVVVTGEAGGPWTIEFIGQYAERAVGLMTASHTLTGGTNPSVVVTIEQEHQNDTVERTWDTDEDFADDRDRLDVVDGVMRLARKGVDFTRVFSDKADWQEGTMTNMKATLDGQIELGIEHNAVDMVDEEFTLGTKTNVVVVDGVITLARS